MELLVEMFDAILFNTHSFLSTSVRDTQRDSVPD